jgi:protein NrfC
MPGGKKPENEEANAKKQYSRRDFLVTGSTLVVVDALIAGTPTKASAAPAVATALAAENYPESKGYLLYDSKKCAGCTTCMLSCSLVHYGVHSLSLARIQIAQDSFGKYPTDLIMAPCRQCVNPLCVAACPVKAAHVDTANGNVRRIDSKKCIGCKKCLSACPFTPHRPVFGVIVDSKAKSSKCDLCIDTPYWNEKGGPGGKQACVEACPFKALKFTDKTPDQTETKGYDVKLRNQYWFRLGFADEDNAGGGRGGGMGGPGGGGFGGGGGGGMGGPGGGGMGGPGGGGRGGGGMGGPGGGGRGGGGVGGPGGGGFGGPGGAPKIQPQAQIKESEPKE